MDDIKYNFTDLKSCYKRQISKVRSIIEELAGRKRKVIISLTKIIPVFNHYINMGYGLSGKYYGSIL